MDTDKLENEHINDHRKRLNIKEWDLGPENIWHEDEFLVFTPVFKYFKDFQVGETLDLSWDVPEEETTDTSFLSKIRKIEKN